MVVLPVDPRKLVIHADEYPPQVVRLAVLVLAEDEDAVAVAHIPGRVAKTRTRRRASALNALASSQRTCRRDARRNTMGDDQISRITILSADFDHSSGGPRWKCLRSPRQ